MSFTDIFIKRWVFATVLSLLLLLLGGVSYFKLAVRQYPKIASTVVTVNVSYPGASANLMEGFVATPLESALAGVDGLDYITSNSTQGTANISLNFKLGYDINVAASDVSDKVSSVRWKLPKEINDPVIAKVDPNAQPTMYIAFTSEQLTPEKVTDYLQRVIQPQIETLEGVGEARIFGPREYAMRVWLDPGKMAAQEITASDVEKALLANNFQAPSGKIEAKYQEFDISAKTDLNTAEEFNRLIIRDRNGQLTRIGDIGKAELGSIEARAQMIANNKKAMVMGIVPRSDANPLDVSRLVNATLARAQSLMPEDLAYNVIWDTSKFVESSIDEVKSTIIEASIIVIFVIFLFLGSFRTLTVPMVTIPLSLIGVCAVMLALGYTLNTMTLLALVLAIGMVVDDAIVVSENVHRHLEEGKPAVAASIIGAREIRFAVLAMTFTLAAVFAPLGFSGGLTGALFREFAFTLAAAVIISGFIALTLSPMMCSKILNRKSLDKPMAKFVDRMSDRMSHHYGNILHFVIKHRIFTLLSLPIIVAVIVFLFKALPDELAPQEDMGAVMVIAYAPANANLSYTDYYTRQLIPIFNSIPETEKYGIINGFPDGVNSAIAFDVLKPWKDRKRGINEIIGSIAPATMSIPGILAFPLNPFSLPGSSGIFPIEFVIQTTGSYDELNATLNKIKTAAMQNPGLTNINTNLKFDKPQVDIEIHRNKAGDLGINMSDIGTTLNIALGQPTVTRFERNGRSYDVIPQLYPKYRDDKDKLNDLYLRTQSGELVSLGNLVTINDSVVPRKLYHFQQLRSANITASMAGDYTMGDAVTFFENTAKSIMSKEMTYDFSGDTRQYIETGDTLTEVMILAVVLIFLMLAAQFGSFRDSIIVLIAILLSTFGALLTLKLVGGTLNIYTKIGMVTLIGLISKHGILLVDFANQAQNDGKNKVDAIIAAAKIRLRPILMTTAAMVLAMVPLAFATGAGAISRQQMGWTIAGGMTIGTLLTLFVVPVIYSYLASVKRPFTTGDEALDRELQAA